MELADRIELGLKTEAELYIKNRTPLKERLNATPEMLARRDAYAEQEKAKYEAKHGTWSFIQIPWTPKQRDSIRVHMVKQLKLLATKFNLLPQEESAWMDDAESLYEITSTFEVISHAKVKGENKSWQRASDADAEAKIGKLIAYKINDRLYKHVNLDVDTSGVRPLILPY